MRVAVTGACGALGRPVCEMLSRRGHEVIAIDRAFCGNDTNSRQADVTDYRQLLDACSGAESIVHLAGIPTPSEPEPGRIFHTNVFGTYLVYEVASTLGVETVVVASSINALGFYFAVRPELPSRLPITEDEPRVPSDPYSYSKSAVEDLGAYFYRREGIVGGSLRIPITIDARKTQENASRYREIRALVSEAMADTSGQWLADFRQSVAGYRHDRVRERNADPADHFTNRDFRLIPWVYGFFFCLELEDLAAAADCLCRARSYVGPVFVGSTYNYIGLDADSLARTFFPEVPREHLESGPMSLVRTTKLRSTTDWEPRHTDAELIRMWRAHSDISPQHKESIR